MTQDGKGSRGIAGGGRGEGKQQKSLKFGEGDDYVQQRMKVCKFTPESLKVRNAP